jgi:hypothetical protein
MAKKKYVPDAEVVKGIGPELDINSLPSNNVTEALHKDAKQKQQKMEHLRAGVTDTPPSPEPLNKETSRSFGSPMSDRNYNKAPEPFSISDKKGKEYTSMSHSGTIREKR